MRKIYITISILIVITAALSTIIPDFVFSAEEYGWTTRECPTATTGFSNPLGTCNIFTILKNIIGYLIMIAAPIVVIMVLYGGFVILTAGDNPEKVSGGRRTIMYAAIGYAIILSSWGIINIIGEVLKTNLVE